MNRTLINTWLGLASDQWPPDHYTLLGLEAGEQNMELVEQRVHERMERVRGYQLSHPEEATEGMNRLAQALVFLTDLASKKTYDARPPAISAVFARNAGAVPVFTSSPKTNPAAGGPLENFASPSTRTIVDSDTTPMPLLAPGVPAAARSSSGNPGPSSDSSAPSKKTVATPILLSAGADPVFETARSSPAATRGLGTKHALYQRLAQTRRLQRAWEKAGDFLSQPRTRLNGPAQESALVRHLTSIRELIDDFPAFLGRAGTPGQHVVCIGRQHLVGPTFKMLDVQQRAALAHDWVAGRTLLAQHRQFLRQELQAYRRRSWWKRKTRAVRSSLNDHPGFVILGAGCVAAAIAIFHWLTAVR
jgi:hypothetical protein